MFALMACIAWPDFGTSWSPDAYPKICQVEIQINDTIRHNLAFITYISSGKSRRSNLIALILAHEDGSTQHLVPGSHWPMLDTHMYLNVTLRQACRDTLVTSEAAVRTHQRQFAGHGEQAGQSLGRVTEYSNGGRTF